MLTTLLEESKGVIIIVGHLAPYVLESAGVDLAIVLRRSPYELTKVLKRRRYSLHKIKENVASEILDISLYDSLQTFGEEKIAELDTTRRTPGHTANEIIRLLRRTRKRKFGTVDWLSMVHKNGHLAKFLEY